MEKDQIIDKSYVEEIICDFISDRYMLDNFLEIIGLNRFASQVRYFFEGYGINVEHIFTAQFWLITFYLLFVLLLILAAYKVYKAYHRVLKKFAFHIDDIICRIVKTYETNKQDTTIHIDSLQSVF